jgi:hypothetical protein
MPDVREGGALSGETFIGKTTITPSIDPQEQTLSFDVLETMNDKMVNHYKEIVDLKEEAIRKGLMALGWTPPLGIFKATEVERVAEEIHFCRWGGRIWNEADLAVARHLVKVFSRKDGQL